CAATVAVLSAKFFERLSFFQPRRQVPKDAKPESKREASTAAEAFDDDTLATPPLSRPAPWGIIALALLTVFFLMLFLRLVMPEVFRLPLPTDPTLQNPFARMVNALSILAIPFLLSFFPVYAAARGIKVYDEFVEGAKE